MSKGGKVRQCQLGKAGHSLETRRRKGKFWKLSSRHEGQQAKTNPTKYEKGFNPEHEGLGKALKTCRGNGIPERVEL